MEGGEKPCSFAEMGDLVFMGDAFRIEDLSEFSNEEIAGPISSNSLSSSFSTSSPHSIDGFSSSFLNQDFGVICPPYNEETGFEWLSDLVEEEPSTGKQAELILAEETKAASNSTKKEQSQRAVPGKARSKRPRACSAPSVLKTWQCFASSNNSHSDNSSSNMFAYEEQKEQKEKKSNGSHQPRRCTHCQSQRTPQWRAGPLGPKTLCNACGVRYKSGRLFPEYRPAKSPTFIRYIHSNSHKKVMEMRTTSVSSTSSVSSPLFVPPHSPPFKLKIKLPADYAAA